MLTTTHNIVGVLHWQMPLTFSSENVNKLGQAIKHLATTQNTISTPWQQLTTSNISAVKFYIDECHTFFFFHKW